MSETRPHFRFFPRAYEIGEIFKEDDTACEACGRTDTPIYKGTVYTVMEPVVCAVCIADGSLGRHLGEEHYDFHESFIDALTGKSLSSGTLVKATSHSKQKFQYATAEFEEVALRTPGFSTFNPYDWPVLNGFPMAFWGFGDDPVVFGNKGALAAMAAREENWGGTAEGLDTYGSPYLLVFKAVDDEQYAAFHNFD